MFHKHRRAFLRQNTAPRIQPVGPTAIVKDPAKTRQPNRAYDRRMMDANYVSERLTSLKQEMRDLQDFNARHCTRNKHTALDKSARTSRQERLLQIKRELSDMLKRCA
jgi:hypothetical protein